MSPAAGTPVLRHPELVPAALVAAAWAGLVASILAGGAAARQVPAIPTMYMPPGVSMPGMDMSPGGGTVATLAGVAGSLPAWILMVVAMMGAALLPSLRGTALRSLRRRRGRAMAEFAGGYLVSWTVFGALALALARTVPHATGWGALAAALALAAAWQLTPAKHEQLRKCHRVLPVPMRGWAAARATATSGVRNGIACIGSCWCMMLAMAVAPGGAAVQFALTAGLAGIVGAEKLGGRPRRTARIGGLLLGLAAAGAAAKAAIPLNG